MALDDRDLQAYQISQDLNLPPEERKSRIDALYDEAASYTAPPPGPDLGEQGASAGPIGIGGLPGAAEPVREQLPPQAVPQETQKVEQAAVEAAPPPPEPEAPPLNLRFAGEPQGAVGTGMQEQKPTFVRVGSNEYQPSARQIQTQVAPQMEPGLEKELTENEAELAKRKGETAYFKSEGQQLIDEQAALTQQKKANLRKEMEDRQAFRSAELRKREDAYSEMLRESTQEMKIDPNRVWDNKSLGDKIMTRIAIGLGAMGALAGAPNIAYEELKSEMERDLEAQKENNRLKGERVVGERSLYDMASTTFSNERERDMAALEAAHANLDAELARFASDTMDPQRKASLDEMRAQNAVDLSNARAQRQLAHQDQVTVQESQRFDPVRMVQTGGPLGGQSLAQAVKEKEMRQKLNAPDPLDIPGVGTAANPESAQAGRELIGAYNDFNATYAEAMQLMAQGSSQGMAGVGGAAYHKALVLMKQRLSPQIAKIKAGGFNPSAEAEKQATDETPDLTSMRQEKAREELTQMKRNMQNTTESKLKAYVPGYGRR